MSYERFKEKYMSSKEISSTTPLNKVLDDDFKGKTIVFTGNLRRYPDKDDVRKEVYKRGAKSVPASLSKSTDFLVVADDKGTSQKDVTAEKLNTQGAHIQIISENTFYKMLENNTAISEQELRYEPHENKIFLDDLINTPVPSNENLAFIDTEWANRNHDICQISVIICSHGNVIKTINSYIKPFGKFDKLLQSIHGITIDKVKDCPDFKKVWENELYEYKDYTFIAHNFWGADRHALRKTMELYNIPYPNFRFIDTQELAKRLIPSSQSFSLSDLCEQFGFPILKQHDSSFDVKGCYDLFWYLYNIHKFDITKEIY